MALTPVVSAVLCAKTLRTFCYGFLGILFPVYLAELGLSAPGIGVAVTLTLVASSALTWAVRRPAERWGGRRVLMALAALSAVAALLLLWSRDPRLVVLAAMIGNVAVGTGETGPFLTLEQVLLARAVPASARTSVLSVYNLVGYAAGALGAAAVAVLSVPATLFGLFLAGAAIQALTYWRLPESPSVARGPAGKLKSGPLIRRLALVFALDSFAGGFVIQSLVAYFLHVRYDLTLETLGFVFFAAQLLTAASLLLAPSAAARFGLLPTMVGSHAISNVFLIAIAFAPTAPLAVAFLFLRQLLSQMDVPTRQAWVMAIVEDHEREAAAAATTLARTVAAAATPALTGWVMQTIALSAPFALGGLLKMTYDFLLWTKFRRVKLIDRS